MKSNNPDHLNQFAKTLSKHFIATPWQPPRTPQQPDRIPTID